MNIKFADEIVKDMDARGRICVPAGYVTGEAFERWMYGGIVETYDGFEKHVFNSVLCIKKSNNEYNENYGDAA